MLSDEEIIAKFRDPDFPGSFSGARNFQVFLKTDLNEYVPLKRIYSILKSLPFYVISQRPIRRFPRRKYDVKSYGALLQADLAFMYEKNQRKYFLVVIDVFSRHLFVDILENKDATTVRKSLEKIFSEHFPTPITKLETDQGGEFVGLKDFFKKHEILFGMKYGKNKSNFAEHAIFSIKKRLFMMLRSETSDNWPKYLPLVVQALNKKPLKLLGGISPGEVNSEWDDVVVQEAQKESCTEVYKEPDWRQQNENQENYLKSKNPFQPGKFVYADKKSEVFDKSFFAQVNFCFCHFLNERKTSLLHSAKLLPCFFVNLEETF
jgi:hypothetical protein